MLGNILISGKNSGQVRLSVNGPSSFQAVATKVGTTLEGVIADAEQKLAELKSNPSPIHSEIELVESWLRIAKDSLTAGVQAAASVAKEEAASQQSTQQPNPPSTPPPSSKPN